MSKCPMPTPVPADTPAAERLCRTPLIARILLVLAFLPLAAADGELRAQGPNPASMRVPERLWVNGRSPMLEDVARAIGDRFQTVGKPRVTIAGTLADGKAERQLTYSWQLPGMFRLEDSQGGLIQFNLKTAFSLPRVA